MYTATFDHDPAADLTHNERALGLLGLVFGVLGSGAILYFWTMGRILLYTNNGGQITQLGLEGAWLFLFNAYPFVMVGCLLIAAGLYWGLKRYKEAAGVAALPVIGTIVYYFALVLLR